MTADTTLAPCPTEREQDLFEAVFPMPPNCTRFPGGYAPTGYSAWAAHTFCDRWEGWKAARRSQTPAPHGPALVQQMLEVMESATSFTSKKSRDEHPNVVAAARKWLSARGITGAPS